MSRKRETAFFGALKEPIHMPNRMLWHMLDEDGRTRFVKEQRAAKLRTLARHYGNP